MIEKFHITRLPPFFVILLLTGCSWFYSGSDSETLYGVSSPKNRHLTPQEAQNRQTKNFISYYKAVKPILDARCVMCHGCYDAPCQLKLTSFEGLDRGASTKKIYQADIFKSAPPTRLFTDANNPTAWRQKNFHPVLNEGEQSSMAAIDNSVLAKLLRLKRDYPLPEGKKLSKKFDLSLDRQQECPTIDKFKTYRQEHPLWGMPYAMPGLPLKEELTLLQWLQEGAKVEPPASLSTNAVQAINQWEHFFNQTPLKNQLVSRYLYEHLFIGHLHFQGHPDNEFYELVRSTTPSGQVIQEIATLRPYEDPKVKLFYYRLRPIVATIVDKTHFVYELSDQRIQRYQMLFLQDNYLVTKLPSYDTESASNPFKTFADIPVSARYQFLLEDAQYFVSGFIKGPVCRGQVALNVIRDRFWVVFANPNMAYAKQGAKFLAENTPLLQLPGAQGDTIGLFDWYFYDQFGEKYLEKKEHFINHSILNKHALDLDFIWKGAGGNENAALTIFRHVDSATVVKGLIGDTPLTAWVLDYPIFERIHYLLVAGFNVYGSVGHQLAARKYMNYLRIDSENNFLRFMPKSERAKLHKNWYKGIESTLIKPPLFSAAYETGVIYKTKQYKTEFFQKLKKKMNTGHANCQSEACTPPVHAKIKLLKQLKGEALVLLPEVSFIRIKTKNPEKDYVYTLLVNRAYSNIAFMVADDYRREPWNDSLTVVPNFMGSYPNFFFSVPENQLEDFIFQLKTARSASEKDLFYQRYGIRRSNPKIWAYYDWFNQRYKKVQGRFAGQFDMNRYQNL
jgi:hypothetical protein